MGDARSADLEVADPVRPHPDGLRVQRPGGERGIVVQRVEAGGERARPEDAHATWRHEVVPQVVTEGDEIDEVVGVEVADHDRRDVLRLRLAEDALERPVPEVEQDARRSLADEVRGARGALTIRIGGTGPEHRQDHACAVIARG